MERAETLQSNSFVLPVLKLDSLAVQLLLVILAAFILPSLAHMTGLSVRTLLPMHWPVILAGLCFGWRSGLMLGISAPLVSYAFSGMPPLPVLPAMTIELAAYGAVAGLMRETFKLNGFVSAAIALIAGRLVFLAAALAVGSISTSFGEYLQAAMLPGIPAAIAQMLVLPLVASWWVSKRS